MIEKLWLALYEDCFKDKFTEEESKGMKMTFYAGATSVIEILLEKEKPTWPWVITVMLEEILRERLTK